jgi:hypothetical protein
MKKAMETRTRGRQAGRLQAAGKSCERKARSGSGEPKTLRAELLGRLHALHSAKSLASVQVPCSPAATMSMRVCGKGIGSTSQQLAESIGDAGGALVAGSGEGGVGGFPEHGACL